MQCDLCKNVVLHSDQSSLDHCKFYASLKDKELMLLAAETNSCSQFVLDSKKGNHFECEAEYR